MAGVIEDLDLDLDPILPIALTNQPGTMIGGSVNLEGLSQGTYAVRVVARTPNSGVSALRNVVRVATVEFAIAADVPLAGLDSIWLAEYLGPQQSRRSVRANLHYLGPEGERASFDGALMHGTEGLPPTHVFEKRAISTGVSDDPEIVHYLSPLDSVDPDEQVTRLVTIPDVGQVDPFVFDTKIFTAGTDTASWVSANGSLGYFFADLAVAIFDGYKDIRALGAVPSVAGADRTWALCGTNAVPGNDTHLRLINRDGTELAESPQVTTANFEQGAILRGMADGGVTAYANYRKVGPRIVRAALDGGIVAASNALPPHVLDLGVNPYTGAAVLVHGPDARRVQLTRLDAGLNVIDVLSPTNRLFDGEFEFIHSADISAPPSGQLIWISGQRKEPQPPPFPPIDRGAVGFLDADDDFTLVAGGLEPISLVRAQW